MGINDSEDGFFEAKLISCTFAQSFFFHSLRIFITQNGDLDIDSLMSIEFGTEIVERTKISSGPIPKTHKSVQFCMPGVQ